jgi:hypothetical protein
VTVSGRSPPSIRSAARSPSTGHTRPDRSKRRSRRLGLFGFQRRDAAARQHDVRQQRRPPERTLGASHLRAARSISATDAGDIDFGEGNTPAAETGG